MNERNEFDLLVERWTLYWDVADFTVESLVHDIPNQGQCSRFIEHIKKFPEDDQAHFLSSLVKFRPECKNRLLEFSKSDDENLVIWAQSGLLFTDLNPDAIKVLVQKIKDRLDDPMLNEGKWPIYFIVGNLVEEGVKGRKKAFKELLSYAQNKPNVDIDTIKSFKIGLNMDE